MFCEPEVKRNDRGYFCIHYIIEPIPYDEQYKESEELLLDKFELQLRTLIREAWGEVEHQVVYKGAPSPLYENKFPELAQFLVPCESFLDSLVKHIPFPAEDNIDEINKDNIEFIKRLTSFIDEVEKKQITDKEKQREIDEFIHNNQSNFDYITKNIKIFVAECMEIALFYLGAGKFEKSKNLYEEILQIDNNDNNNEWVQLRLSEVYIALDNIEKAKEINKNLSQRLLSEERRKNQTDDDAKLYNFVAFRAWEFEAFEDAVELSLILLNLIKDPYHEQRVKLNIVYYKIKILLNKSNDDEFLDGLNELKKNIDEVLEYLENKENKKSSNFFDSIAWWYYQRANAFFNLNNITEATNDIDKAFNYISECWAMNEKKEYNMGKEVLATHDKHLKEISLLKSKINNKKKDLEDSEI